MPRMQTDVLQKIDLVGYLHNLVFEHPDFEVLCGPKDGLYCFRYVPNGLADDPRADEQSLNRINETIVASVRRKGFTSITSSKIGSLIAICISISDGTTTAEVDKSFEAIARLGQALKKRSSALGLPFDSLAKAAPRRRTPRNQLKRDTESVKC